MSMLVVAVTATAVLFGADSKQFPNGITTVQKMFLVGNHGLLGHSGVGLIPADNPAKQGSWDAAKETARIARTVPAGTPTEPLSFIASATLEILNAGIAKRTLPMQGDHPRFFLMFVDRDKDGRVFFARKVFDVVSVPSAKGRWKHHAIEEPPQVLLNQERREGLWQDAPGDCPVDKYRPSVRTVATLSKYINDVAGQSTQCTKEIGGALRFATIDKDGARWLQQ